MTPNYVFVKGRKDPLTTSDLAAETGIDRQIITNRASRARSKRFYKGKFCGVLSKADLLPPIPRSSDGQELIVRLNPSERDVLTVALEKVEADPEVEPTLRKVKNALKLGDGARRAISAWDARVRNKNA